MRHAVRALRAGSYLWALPVTLFGLGLAGCALLSGGRVRRVSGVLEAHGGAAAVLLRRFVPLRGGASAMTLGHVVLGRDAGALERTRVHERAHVRQCERWGVLFIPAYALASALAAARGRHYYRDNCFEREAVAAADAATRVRRGLSPRDR
ncbi:MAG TPA: hypothetical protein VFT13_00735 [Candidatus Krumholzibacteria bacterium]|nr:hypothetical protein [Candidatus Krumholzibacteria bacterium]